MKFFVLLSLAFGLPLHSLAEPWTFSNKLLVSPHNGKRIFHHLDASGRKSIAISANSIAVVWEDNHSGGPQVYVAFKSLDEERFTPPLQVSTGNEAYEPTITALDAGRFVLGWEQDGAIWLRTATRKGLALAHKASQGEASQVSLAARNKQHIIASWTVPSGKVKRVVTATVRTVAAGGGLQTSPAEPVDPAVAINLQIKPTLTISNKGAIVAWEDRRRGHTTLLYSQRPVQGKFSSPRLLNEVVQKSNKYGRGSGVTRVALATLPDGRSVATWMDKRAFRSGYDIYAAFTGPQGRKFSTNQIVQDPFAESISQWRPAVTATPQGLSVIAWDDDRDDSSDIWLSWSRGSNWSEDLSVAPASGTGDQTSAALVSDREGNLHLVWIDQARPNAPTRLYYSFGKRKPSP